MGNITPREEEKAAAGLPKIFKKYIPVSILKSEKYGSVLKIREQKTKNHFTIRVVKYVPGDRAKDKGLKGRLQKVQNEKNILLKLSHPNLIKYYESFATREDPISPNTKEPYLCLRMEHCHGNHLGAILSDMEKKKERIPIDMIITNFVKILKAVKVVHDKKCIHRNLRPENVLVKLSEGKAKSAKGQPMKIDVRISDFGLATDTGKVGKAKKSGNIVGKIFYSSQELSEGKGYDFKTDIYALGLILYQAYSGKSVKTFNKTIFDLRKKLGELEEEEEVEGESEEEEKDGKKKKKKKKKPKKKTKKQQEKDQKAAEEKSKKKWEKQLDDLRVMHERGILLKEFLAGVEDDPGIQYVLTKMLAPIRDRPTAEELVKDPVVISWQYLLTGRLKGGSKMDPKDVDVRAALTLLKNRKELVFKRCLEVLCSKTFTDDEVDAFIAGKGHKWLMMRFAAFLPRMKKRKSEVREWAKDIMKIFLLVFWKLSKSRPALIIPFFHMVSQSVRKFQQVNMFRAYLKFVCSGEPLKEIPSTMILLFTLVLTSASRSVAADLSDLAPIVAKFANENKNTGTEMLSLGILENMVMFLKPNVVTKVLQNYKGSHLSFTKTLRKDTREENMNLVKGIMDRMKHVRIGTAFKKEPYRQIDALSLPVFFATDYSIIGRGDTLKLVKPDKKVPTIKCKFRIHKSSDPKSVKLTKNGFATVTNKKAEMITTETILSLKSFGDDEDKEVAVAYFEVSVDHGGETDELGVGLNLHSSVKRKILYYPTQKSVVLSYAVPITLSSGKKAFRNKLENFEIQDTDIDIIPQPGTIVGAGITNKGNAFFTYNGRLMQPFVNFVDNYPEPCKKGLFGVSRVIGNAKFRATGCFTKTNFPFLVGKIGEPGKTPKGWTQASQLSESWTKDCKKIKVEKDPKDPLYVVCARLLEIFDLEPLGDVDDRILAGVYESNGSLRSLMTPGTHVLDKMMRKLTKLRIPEGGDAAKKKEESSSEEEEESEGEEESSSGEEESSSEEEEEEKKKKKPADVVVEKKKPVIPGAVEPKLPIHVKKKKDAGPSDDEEKKLLVKLKKELEDMKEKIGGKDKLIEDLKKEKEELVKKAESGQEKAKKVDELQEELIKQSEKVEKLMKDMEELQGDDGDDNEEEIKQLKEKLEKKTEEVEVVKKQSEEEVEKLKEAMRKLEEESKLELGKIGGKNEELEAKIEELTKTVELLTKSLEEEKAKKEEEVVVKVEEPKEEEEEVEEPKEEVVEEVEEETPVVEEEEPKEEPKEVVEEEAKEEVEEKPEETVEEPKEEEPVEEEKEEVEEEPKEEVKEEEKEEVEEEKEEEAKKDDSSSSSSSDEEDD